MVHFCPLLLLPIRSYCLPACPCLHMDRLSQLSPDLFVLAALAVPVMVSGWSGEWGGGGVEQGGVRN